LSILALVIVGVLLFWLRKADGKLIPAAIGLIVGGAVGNVIDRVVHGAVVDFLDVYWGGYHWPAFNVADSGITVGAILLVVDSLFSGRAQKG
jgi:signal peptidase II